MEVTFSPEESNDLIMAGMAHSGFTDIDPATLEISVKSLRDGSGGNQITCNFNKLNATRGQNSTLATASAQEKSATAGQPANPGNDDDDVGPSDSIDTSVPDVFGSSDANKDLFGQS